MADRRPFACALVSAALLLACESGGDAPADATASAPDTTVVDAAPAPDVVPGTTFETCIPPHAPEFLRQTLELATADGATRVRIAVEPGDGPSVGETFPFELLGFALERDGVLTCVTDAAALTYVYGHHNWDERATATVGDTTYVLTMAFEFSDMDGAWTDRLEARDASDAVLWGPLELPTVRCEAEGSGALNGCFRREKADL